jgi:hypothetical protein
MSEQTTTRHDLEISEVEKDRLSSRVRKLRSQGQPVESFSQLVEKGEAIAETVTYLDENLRLLEADEAHQTVTLRSDHPQRSADELEYFEVSLQKDGETTLTRKRYRPHDTETESVDFVVTEKTLERLGRDLKAGH